MQKKSLISVYYFDTCHCEKMVLTNSLLSNAPIG